MGGGVIGVETGVIKALRNLKRLVDMQANDASVMSLDERAEIQRQGKVAIDLTEQMLDCLPQGFELAAIFASEYARRRESDGLTPAVKSLGIASKRVEQLMDGCKSLTLSSNISAVETASSLMGEVLQKFGDNGIAVLAITRGDVLSPSNHGATVSASYPNGSRLDISLRQSSTELDDGIEPGLWLVEGGALLSNDPRADNPCIDEIIGRELTPATPLIIEHHLRKLISACLGANVRLLAIQR